jgi:hypothetical protein
MGPCTASGQEGLAGFRAPITGKRGGSAIVNNIHPLIHRAVHLLPSWKAGGQGRGGSDLRLRMTICAACVREMKSEQDLIEGDARSQMGMGRQSQR